PAPAGEAGFARVGRHRPLPRFRFAQARGEGRPRIRGQACRAASVVAFRFLVRRRVREALVRATHAKPACVPACDASSRRTAGRILTPALGVRDAIIRSAAGLAAGLAVVGARAVTGGRGVPSPRGWPLIVALIYAAGQATRGALGVTRSAAETHAAIP